MYKASAQKILAPGLGLILGFGVLPAAANPDAAEREAAYSAELEALKTEITRSLPRADERKSKALENAREEVLKAAAAADAASKDLGQIASGKGLVAHAKGKWIGGVDKGIAAAKAALAKATNAAEKAAAEKDLAHWQQNRKEGEEALAERQAALDKALQNEAQYKKAHESAQAALAVAKEKETKASKDLLDSLASALASDKMDGKLAKAAVLTAGTPKALA